MVDNFDYKKYLTDNQLGPYAKAKAKANEVAEESKKSLTSTKTDIKKSRPSTGKNRLAGK